MVKLFGKVSLVLVMTLAVAGGLFVAALLTAVEWLAPPNFSSSLATVQNITADAWLVFDPETRQVIYAYQEDEVLPIASVTKLFAARTFYKENDVWATTTVTWSDLSGDGRAGSLQYGKVYNFYTLLFPLLLESSNDAAEVLERNDKELVQKMNSYASTLELEQTAFVDASGLSSGDVSSALDLATLTTDIFKNTRHVIDITSLPLYIGEQGWLNNNPFATDEKYQGGKHGYTPEANRTAVLLFEESLKNGVNKTVGYILLGSSDLEYDVKLLRNHVQSNVTYR